LTSLAVVLAGEAALLLHELSHAFAARRGGQVVRRIIFHGFVAETVVGEGVPGPVQETLIALAGPLMNLTLAALAAGARVALGSEGALDVFLLALMVGNLAMAAMSLLPLGGSDGARIYRAWARRRR
jgi:Zn-dependent protease